MIRSTALSLQPTVRLWKMLCLAVAVIVGLPVSLGAQETRNPNRPIADKWAVLIGISKFANQKISPLRYPAKDAQDFCNFVIAQENFARDHVLLLTDERATKVKILEAFGDGWLPQRVMADDLVLVYISTHGSPADRAGENFIIAYDSDPEHPYATGIRLQDLSRELTVRTGCDRLVLLLDACHSGAAVSESRSLLRAPTNFDLEAITGSGQLVISSSKSSQVSWESKRYSNGVFTAQLMRALQKRGRQTTLEEAYRYLREGVETEVRFDRLADQTPVMLDKWTGARLALAAPAASPRCVLPELPSAVQPLDLTAHGTIMQPIPSLPPVTHPLPQQPVPRTMGSGLVQPPMMTSCWTSPQGDPTLERGTRLLEARELKVLSRKQLLKLYNEAYARHGRGFMIAELQAYFEAESWYSQDPDYHWRPDDPRVRARRGQPDDSLIINQKRTPKQWANLQLIKRAMSSPEAGTTLPTIHRQ